MTKTDIRLLHENAEKALKSAVKKAFARHDAAGVPAAIWRDGKVVYLLRGRIVNPGRRKKKRK